jgi:hypothetical protein
VPTEFNAAEVIVASKLQHVGKFCVSPDDPV